MKLLVIACVLCAASACGTHVSTQDAAMAAANAADSFAALGARGRLATVRIAYSVVSKPGTKRQMIFAQKPPQRSFRMNTSDGDTFLIANGDDLIACGDGSCFRLGSLGSESASAGTAFFGTMTQALDALTDDSSLPAFASRGSQIIAGRATICAAWKARFSKPLFSECLDAGSGVPLWFLVDGADGLQSVTASHISIPSQTDFAPTYPVEEIPSGFKSPDVSTK